MEPLPPGAEELEPPVPGVDSQVDAHYGNQFAGNPSQQAYYLNGGEYFGQPAEYAFDAYSLSHQGKAVVFWGGSVIGCFILPGGKGCRRGLGGKRPGWKRKECRHSEVEGE